MCASASTVDGVPVGGLVAHCACCPCVLRAVRGFQACGALATCLLLTGAPGFGYFLFSSASLSLSLSLCASLVRPFCLWGLFLVGSGVCLCSATKSTPSRNYEQCLAAFSCGYSGRGRNRVPHRRCTGTGNSIRSSRITSTKATIAVPSGKD